MKNLRKRRKKKKEKKLTGVLVDASKQFYTSKSLLLNDRPFQLAVFYFVRKYKNRINLEEKNLDQIRNFLLRGPNAAISPMSSSERFHKAP